MIFLSYSYKKWTLHTELHKTLEGMREFKINFDFQIFNELINADRVHHYGFFIGNHHYDIRGKIDYLKLTIDKFINESIR